MRTATLTRQCATTRKDTCFGLSKVPRRAVLRVRAEEGVQAAPKAPKGVTKPQTSPELPPATFGFVENAERLNSRAAMIGFFALIALEVILGRGLLEAVGLKVGNGLPFEI